MSLETALRTAFLRRLVSTPRGRAHILNLMVNAEEGDEAGVFDQLRCLVTDPQTRKTIERHQNDERGHANLYRKCIERTGVEPEPIPDELMIIRRVARVAGGPFADGERSRSAHRLTTDRDIMNTYALLLVIEERGVEQFPIIGQEFRHIGDFETADTFDRVARDEARHCKYCQAIGRRYAESDREWEEAVARFRRIETRAFKQAGLAGIAYAIDKGLVWHGLAARGIARAIRHLDPFREAQPGQA